MSHSLPSSLFRLPRELRDQIYTELFALPHIDQSGQRIWHPLLLDVGAHIPYSPLGLPTGNAIPFSMLAPLCRASKQLYWEATPPYLSSCILSLDHISTTKFLMDWLSMFEDKGFREVRHLEFADFSQYDEAEGSIDHSLILSCPNLQTLGVKFRNTDKLGFPDEPPRRRYISNHRARHRTDMLEEIGRRKATLVIDSWNLESLLDIRDLTKISIGFPDETSISVKQGLALESKDWLNRMLIERGHLIEVDCGFDDSAGW